MRVSFFGAAGTVTGSRFLLEHERTRILVDAGLFQGGVELRTRNAEPLPFDPSSLDAIVLTHAHLDHAGALPLLVRQGFRGKIFATSGTRDLAEILLLDAARLQEEDTKRAARRGLDAVPPLFTSKDAESALARFHVWPFGEERRLGSLHVRLSAAGHILGAACVHIRHGHRTLVLSGDVGRPNDVLMRAPEPIGQADALVVESTYGGRTHDATDAMGQIAAVVRRAIGRGGAVVVPAFSVGRAQTILLAIAAMREEGELADVPVFLDSPMAIDATDIYCRHLGEHRLDPRRCHAMCNAASYVRDARQSRDILEMSEPHVVIAGSGMATGGRVVAHLERRLPDPRSAVLFAGYQAPGTRGAKLCSGPAHISLFGESIAVRAEIARIGSLSAHADEPELLSWLSSVEAPPGKTFVVHGEPASAEALGARLYERGWPVHIAAFGDTAELDDG